MSIKYYFDVKSNVFKIQKDFRQHMTATVHTTHVYILLIGKPI